MDGKLAGVRISLSHLIGEHPEHELDDLDGHGGDPQRCVEAGVSLRRLEVNELGIGRSVVRPEERRRGRSVAPDPGPALGVVVHGIRVGHPDDGRGGIRIGIGDGLPRGRQQGQGAGDGVASPPPAHGGGCGGGCDVQRRGRGRHGVGAWGSHREVVPVGHPEDEVDPRPKEREGGALVVGQAPHSDGVRGGVGFGDPEGAGDGVGAPAARKFGCTGELQEGQPRQPGPFQWALPRQIEGSGPGVGAVPDVVQVAPRPGRGRHQAVPAPRLQVPPEHGGAPRIHLRGHLPGRSHPRRAVAPGAPSPGPLRGFDPPQLPIRQGLGQAELGIVK